MPVSSEFQHGICVVTIEGEFPLGELVDSLHRAYGDPNFTGTTPVLIDWRQSIANPRGQEVREACLRLIGRRPAGHGGRWAIVTRAEPLQFGIGRMVGLTLESLGASAAVFTNMAESVKYLNEP